MGMSAAQWRALKNLSDRYEVDFQEKWFVPAFDLPPGYVKGWIGGPEEQKLYVGCSPDGQISS
jgi:hypothetical protein